MLKGPSRREDHRIRMEKERRKSGGEEMIKGPWRDDEDEALVAAISVLGERRWESLAKASGLRRSGKSCRVRWMNSLRPNLKHGRITQQEESLIFRLHKQWGNRWSRIGGNLTGRTDNEIKNCWRSHSKKKPHLAQKEIEQLVTCLSTNATMELTFSSSNTNKWDEKSTAGISDQASSTPPSSCNNGDHKFDNAATIDKLTSTSLDWKWSSCSEFMDVLVDDQYYCSHHLGWVTSCSCCGYNDTSLWDTSASSIWHLD